MTVVMLLVVRDDADVVDAQIAFHLSLGIDFVYATDHESTDGAADILQSYVRDGVLRWIPQTGLPQDASWRAAMARRAVEERGASLDRRCGRRRVLDAACRGHRGVAGGDAREVRDRSGARSSLPAEHGR